ncbi:exodeoxyribonuclease V subunit beta [Paucibacter aquatile]|uniref:RecBCD enzyme subunit RecB n=1 Tax=Kinneretia aquatilis TaxID=2070761 RepID=A0A2N8KX02_9BURK|nr:exodeoxyribonuclease V subunit beta [Paucibacter aquatile]PND37989.1 exodeoxyribonuclease V subunit beta [Paucibacter aquatile]
MIAFVNTPGIPLDPLSFPLWGSRLIEASAGTGKTWTIAALYLRLVLGHGGEEAAFERPLQPAEILVMTFTRAATRELSDRIRARLLEAARVFRGELAAPDGLLQALLEAYPEGPGRRAAAWRLAAAAEGMDEAAVHTIDAWCQRMLREHAFDSGCLFDEELVANERLLLDGATQDYWRQQVYPLAGEQLDAVFEVWPGVAALGADAQALMAQELDQASEGAGFQQALPGSLGALIEALQARRREALALLKDGWVERAEAMQRWIDVQLAPKQCAFDKRKLATRHYTAWLKTLAEWALDPEQETLELSDSALKRLPLRGMKEALKPDAAEPDWPPEFAAFEELLAGLAALPSASAPLRLHAALHIRDRLAELKRQDGSFGFADMLQRLDEALDEARHGDHARRLRERMRAQYPVALIDEFQDTSPLQTRIFDRLYRIAGNARDSTLLLIGDPKQSIYGFRGADIYSYLNVRRQTEGRHYLLGTNHRSTQALVQAVNSVFARAEAFDAGAFLLGSAGLASPLPFQPVAARGRGEVFVCSSGAVPALQLWLDLDLQDGRASLQRFGEVCAETIVSLLNDEKAGFLNETQGRFQRLRPADIAVLVRNAREASAVREAMRRRGLASVYLSDKDSVFASDEARDLLAWLRAVASPLDARLVRAALASPTLGLSLVELAELARDDEAFDLRSEQLKALHSVWQQQGVLSMLRQTLHRLQLPSRWLAAGLTLQVSGERRLTNVLHLAELLQSASSQLDGEQALIRWLAAQIAEPGSTGGEEQIVRLESDADLVRVVTVHKSKGLEYPLVFLPFAASFRAVDKRRARYVKLEQQLHLEPDAEQIAAADLERQREDLRLFYVALTRARHALWLGVSALKVGQSDDCQVHRSALGYVLGGGVPQTPEELWSSAEDLAAGDPAGIHLSRLIYRPDWPCSALQARGSAPPLREAEVYEAQFERRWTVSSFSALVRALSSAKAPALDAGRLISDAAARDDEDRLADPEAAALAAQAPAETQTSSSVSLLPAWHRFPRGAFAGNFLHDQLEWLAGEGFALAESPALQAQLRARCERQGWGNWSDEVLSWLSRLLQTPLPPLSEGASLARLDALLPEMEFWFPSSGLSSQSIDALCRQHLLGGRPRPALPERALQGLMMGFADLVFEQGGRFWVLDYKSNALGERDADYDHEVLEAAMAEHRYDVQAALYLLALHRLLRQRLGELYEPAQHLGGALYLFMRGMDGPEAGCLWVRPPLALLEGLEDLIDAQHQEEEKVEEV